MLGIESSCDDTGVAIINQDGKVLSNCIHSQLRQHIALGGIIPTVAKEYHVENIDRVARQAFEQSALNSVAGDIDAIAVSTRPGLHFSLEVGLNYARKLAKKYSKPLIPIHHMQAHALMPLLEHANSIKFPYLAVLLSGGHCLIAIAKRYNEFHLLGSSRDQAPGDVLDKFARRCRLKNLGPPFDEISGGASIELLSKRPGADRFKYFGNERSIPMLQFPHCDFSFSGYCKFIDSTGLVADSLWSTGGEREQIMDSLADYCASFQRAILLQIARKLHRALMFYRMHWRYKNEDAFGAGNHLGFGRRIMGRRSVTNNHQAEANNDYDDDEDESGCIDVLVSGGVAANSYLVGGIKLACEQILGSNVKIFVPSKGLCSDNGLMVAWNGLLRYKDFLATKDGFKLSAGTNLSIENSVICDHDQMDLVQVIPQSPIGLDISDQVKAANFRLTAIKHPEFRISPN